MPYNTSYSFLLLHGYAEVVSYYKNTAYVETLLMYIVMAYV